MKSHWRALNRRLTKYLILERITLAASIRIDNREARVKVGRSVGR